MTDEYSSIDFHGFNGTRQECHRREKAWIVFDGPLRVFIRSQRGHRRLKGHATANKAVAIGMVGPVLLLVVHTWPEGDEAPVGRIVSARKATAQERKAYEEEGL